MTNIVFVFVFGFPLHCELLLHKHFDIIIYHKTFKLNVYSFDLFFFLIWFDSFRSTINRLHRAGATNLCFASSSGATVTYKLGGFADSFLWLPEADYIENNNPINSDLCQFHSKPLPYNSSIRSFLESLLLQGRIDGISKEDFWNRPFRTTNVCYIFWTKINLGLYFVCICWGHRNRIWTEELANRYV